MKSLHELRGANLIALQLLTRYRYHPSSQLTREKNHVLNNIFLKFSQLRKKQDKNDDTNPFSDLLGATVSSISIDFATLDEIVEMPMNELVEYHDTKGNIV